jgi:hypothetical protein
MQRPTFTLTLLAGIGIGVIVSLSQLTPTRSARAAASDRFQDYVMCTGAVSINPRMQSDGVWLLDYRSGKLLGTVIDKSAGGRIVGWAEVDLAAEFDVKPLQDVHFIMTTGYITQGQSALYVAETSTGKFGVYTMGPGQNGESITIRRHDMTSFRTVANRNGTLPASNIVPGVPVAPVPNLGQAVPGSRTVPTAPVPSATFPSPVTVPGAPVPTVPEPTPRSPQPLPAGAMPTPPASTQVPLPADPVVPGMGVPPIVK